MKSLAGRKWVWLAAFTLLAAGAVVYRPSLDVGFWTDDYSFLEMAGRLSLPDYIRLYLDPWLQSQWYRPLQGMMWWVVYVLLGKDPLGYHMAQVAIHLANCLLLYGVVTRVTRRWRLAFLVALVYLTLPVYGLAVNWVGVADPLASLFYLLALWAWVGYLRSGSRLEYGFTFLAVVAALLSKEVSITLPFALLLADLWLVRRGDIPDFGSLEDFQSLWVVSPRVSGMASAASSRTRGAQFIRRYAPIFLLLPFYLLLELPAVTQGVFTQRQGYGVGLHMLVALANHMGVLAFPWGIEPPWNYAWLAVVLVLLALAIRRERAVLFVVVAALLAVLPVVPFPLNLAQSPRYLYLPLMASAIGAGWAIESLVLRARSLPAVAWTGIRVLGALAVGGLVTWSSLSIAETAVNFAGTTRAVRLQFRPIFQRHATVEPDTLLYFLHPPFPTPNIGGLMFQRYGVNVRVFGTDRDRPANVRDHASAFVYYLDDRNIWQEQGVDKNMLANAAPPLPVRLGEAIELASVDLASANVKRGEAIIVLLYWHSLAKTDRDYTVFTHLLDASGKTVAGTDQLPRQGYSPTSRWQPGEFLADGVAIPVDAGVPPGDYVLEVGLYDAKTLQRLAVLDAGGQPVDDKILIKPVHIGE